MPDSALVEHLRRAVGTEAVRTDATELDARSHDTWPVATVWAKLGRHPHRPDVVVRADSVETVVATVRTASEHRTPVTPWGLGSSVTGQPLPVRGGIVLDLSGLVGEPSLSEIDHTVTAPAGVRGSDLESWLDRRGYTLNHSPQSLARSTVGGWLATRATGQFSSRYGGIEDLVVGYQVVLADGTVAQVEQRPRAAMGPDLRAVFLGSEGTLGIITAVTLKIFSRSPHRSLEAFTLPSVTAGLTVMRTIGQTGLRPALVRFYDAAEARHAVPEGPHGSPVLFLGHEGIGDVARAEHAASAEVVLSAGGVSLGAEPVDAWMARRYDFSSIESRLAEPGGYAETIEVANLWSRLEPMYHDLRRELTPLAEETLGHFSHIYDQGSSLYLILLGRAGDDRTALSRLEEIWARAMKVVVAHHGEVSHHHGGGLARQPWVAQSLGGGHEILRRIKDALDPGHLLNPGKLGLDPE
ncbi:FAD-binding oxidoreductase [Actinoallomurus acaciae]|uniref:FAD-binding oxidoreductase n=1 Tax=Actinoallomurus acaciae TaxID=502577 RepID=A0ABV5YAF9_9ACTN